MALPLLLLIAGGVLVLGKKKKRSSSKSNSNGNGNGNDPGPGPGPRRTVGGLSARPSTGGGGGGGSLPGAQPWDYCSVPGNPEGEHYAALSSTGECKVFWTPQTRELSMRYLEEEFSSLSQPQKVAICKPGAEAKQDAIAAKVAVRMFPQLAGHIPPAYNDKYFPKMVWERVRGMFLVNFCNLNRVT
jgi:hypothetical protein